MRKPPIKSIVEMLSKISFRFVLNQFEFFFQSDLIFLTNFIKLLTDGQ